MVVITRSQYKAATVAKNSPFIDPFKDIKRLTGSIKLDYVNGCDLRTIFTDIQYKPPNSVSHTILLIGKLKNAPYENIIMKISPSNDENATDNSQFIEKEIYTKIINKMYFERITPHVTPYLGTFQCNDFISSIHSYLNTSIKKQIKERWNSILQETHTDNSVFAANFIIMQMNKGVTFYDYLLTLKPDTIPEDHHKLVSLVFQILYTLHSFNQVGLRHNDLHLNNIFVETNSTIKELSYFIDKDTVYTVPTYGLIAKIYDFDHSSVMHMTENTKLNSSICKTLGMCNGENPVFDIYTFIYILYFTYLARFAPTQLKTDLQKIIKGFNANTKKLYYDESRNFYRPHLMCNITNSGCDGNYVWQGKNLPTPEVFLRTLDTFQSFRRDPSSINVRLSSTFFADENVRSHFSIKYTKAPNRPVINKAYRLKCIKCSKWQSKFKEVGQALKPINGKMLVILFDWIADSIPDLIKKGLRGSENRRFFTLCDTIIEYVQRYPIGIPDLQLVGILFMHKYYFIDKLKLIHWTAGGATEQRFDHSVKKVMDFIPSCNTTFDYLYYCEHPDITKRERRTLKKKYRDVLNLLAQMYSHGDWMLIHPLVRAKWIKDKILYDNATDDAINLIYNLNEPTKETILALIDKVAEPSPKYAI